MSEGRSKRGLDGVLRPKGRETDPSESLLPPLGDRIGPAHRRSQGASGAMVQAVLQAALIAQEQGLRPEALDEEVSPVRAGAGSRSHRRVLMVAAASFALFSAGAVAAVVVARTAFEAEPVPAPRSAAPLASTAEAPPVEEEPEEEALEVEAAEPVVVLNAEKAPTRVRKTVRRRTHRRTPAPVSKASMEGVDLASAPPEDLFALANRLRKKRDWRAADEVYGAVAARVPGSDAAVVAEIASATLHVEQLRDAPGALEGYQRALVARPTGALAEDARWGIAEAQRALRDRHGELRALLEFLDRHPDSALAPAARRRVSELAR
jgi:hypothetical protein